MQNKIIIFLLFYFQSFQSIAVDITDFEPSVDAVLELFSGVGDILMGGVGDLDLEAEEDLGNHLSIMAFQKIGPPVEFRPIQIYLNLVGHSVAQNSVRKEIRYRFVLLDEARPHAVAVPGGVIYITTGLFNHLEDESELAAVLAHEIAHIENRDAIKLMRQLSVLQGLTRINAVRMQEKEKQLLYDSMQHIHAILFDRGHNQQLEELADRRSIELLERTGYAPSALERILRRIGSTRRADILVPMTGVSLQDSGLVQQKERFMYYRERYQQWGSGCC